MTYHPALRGGWVKLNNEAVSQLSASSDLATLSQTLTQLLTEIQSIPTLALIAHLELTVSFNLLSLSWTSPSSSLLNTILTSLTRIISHHIPVIVWKHEKTSLLAVLPHFLSSGVLGHMSSSCLETVMDIVSLLVVSRTFDSRLVKFYLDWSNKVESYLGDVNGALLQDGHEEGGDYAFKINIVSPSNTGRGVTTSCTTVCKKVTEIVTNNIVDGSVNVFKKENEFLSHLFDVAIHHKQCNRLKLASSINKVLASSSVMNQTEAVTRLGLLLRGEFLLEEGRTQGAMSSFGEVIKGDGQNLRAYLGIAACFEAMGRFNNELDIWNIISQILRAEGKIEVTFCSLYFVERIIFVLFPFNRISLVEALVTWARKCFQMGEYQDSSEKFLDAIALVTAGGTFNEGLDLLKVKQEAALALLIVGNVAESLLISEDLVVSRLRTGKRKHMEIKQNDLVVKFLLSKAHFLKGDSPAALLYLDQSLRCCLEMTEQRRQLKIMKREIVEEEGNSEGNMLEALVRVRARLYFEKGMVYRVSGDKKSFKLSVSSAIRLSPNKDFGNYYLEFLEIESKEEFEALQSSMNKYEAVGDTLTAGKLVEDVGLRFLLDSSTIHIISRD